LEFWKNIYWQEKKSLVKWKNILTEEEFLKREKIEEDKNIKYNKSINNTSQEINNKITNILQFTWELYPSCLRYPDQTARMFDQLLVYFSWSNDVNKIKNFFLSLDKKSFRYILKILDNPLLEIKDKKRIFEFYYETMIFLDSVIDWILQNIWAKSKHKKNIQKDLFKKIWDLLKEVNKTLYSNWFNIKDIHEKLNNFNLKILQAWNIFKQLDDNFSIEDLEKIWIDVLMISNISKLNKKEKHKIYDDLIKLYYENYDTKKQKEFLKEIKENLKKSLDKDTKVYLFYVNWEPILSSYLEKQEDWSLYWWWLNWDTQIQQYQFWIKVAEKIMEAEWKNNDIHATTTYEIEWKKNKRARTLLRIYKSKFWLEKFWEWKTKTSNFYKLFREKDNKEKNHENINLAA